MSEKNNKNILYCSFCGKSQHEVRKLIAGPTVFICDECVELCMDIIKEENKDKDTLSVSSRYLSLFPNFIIGSYFPNQIGVYLNVPISPGLTTQKRIIYTTDGKTMSKEEINLQKKIWWDVHKEDHAICERLQEGRSSPASEKGGLLSPHWEKSVQAFQKLIINSTMKYSKTTKGRKNV